MNGWLRYNVRCSADVAQSVEHLIGNEEVGSSNLLISSKNRNRIPRGMRFLFFVLPRNRPVYRRFLLVLVMGAEPSAACGGYSEAKAR